MLASMTSTSHFDSQDAKEPGYPPIHVRTHDSLEELVRLNPDLRIEQAASGEVILMVPTGGESGYRNSLINAQIVAWAEVHGGWVFDSSTLFCLPNGAKRSPDVSWVRDSRWQQLTSDERAGFPPLGPDLVVELRSPSDRLIDLQEKMAEYRSNDVQLGWLIDPIANRLHIYRPDQDVEILERPDSVSAGDLCPGLVLDLKRIWSGGSIAPRIQ